MTLVSSVYHCACDIIGSSAVLAGVRRATGLAARDLVPRLRSERARVLTTKFLDIGEYVVDKGIEVTDSIRRGTQLKHSGLEVHSTTPPSAAAAAPPASSAVSSASSPPKPEVVAKPHRSGHGKKNKH